MILCPEGSCCVQKVLQTIANDVPRVSIRDIGTSMILRGHHEERFFVFDFLFWPF